ncbi:MAG: hypothetical protein AAFY99_03295 [Pseudomonadota bacterium]
MIQTRILTFAATTVLAGASLAPTSALAQIVGNDVITALNNQLSYQGAAITGGDIATSGDTIVITNATMSVTGEDGAFPIEELTLEGVQPDSDGGYTVAKAIIPPFEVSDSGTTATIGGITVTDYKIAAPDETDVVVRSGLFRTMTMGPIAVSEDGQQGFTAAGVAVEVGEYQPGQPWASSFVLSDFAVDTTVVGDPQSRQTMAALGYESLTGDITGSASWDAASGMMSAQDFMISVDDAASIGLDFSLGGYTAELVAAMQQINATAESEQAAGMAMLGLMQQIEIAGAAITVTDASLTNKLLEFFGTQQGTNADGMRAFAKGMLPLGLAQLQSPEFAAKATAAIGSFLDNPGKLVVEAKPAQPIPAMQLAAPLMSGNPALLIQALALDIRAE